MSEDLIQVIRIEGQDQASASFQAVSAALQKMVAQFREADDKIRASGRAWTETLDTLATSARAATASAVESVTTMRDGIAAEARAIQTSLSGTFSTLPEGASASTSSTITRFAEFRGSILTEIDSLKAGLSTTFAPIGESMTVAADAVTAGAASMKGALDSVLTQARAVASEMRAINIPAAKAAAVESSTATTASAAGGGILGAVGLNPITAFVGGAGMAAFQGLSQGHEIARTIESGLDPKELGLNKDQFISRLQADASALGESVEEVAKSYAAGARILQGVDPRERFDLIRKLLRPAEYESQIKGTSLPEAVTAFLEMSHQMGEYSPDGAKRLAQQFAAASLSTKAPLDEITNTASYFLPQLHATLGLDAPTGLAMLAAGKNAGLSSTKAGTNIRAFEENLFANGNTKHDAELQKLGLIDGSGKSLWNILGKDGKTDWLASNLKAGEILQRSIGALPEDERLKALKESMGEQGGRYASLMATPTFRDQISGIRSKIDTGADGDQLGRLQAEDPMQQFRQTWTDTKNVLADIGTVVLPPLLAGLKGFDAALQGVHAAFQSLFDFVGKWTWNGNGFASGKPSARNTPDTPLPLGRAYGGARKQDMAEVTWDDDATAGGGMAPAMQLWAQQAVYLQEIKAAIEGSELTTLRSIETDVQLIGTAFAEIAKQGGFGIGGGGLQNASFEQSDDSSGGVGSGVVATGSMKSRGQAAMAHLMAMGVSKEAAAAIVGNAQQESGITSDGRSGDHGSAHGMFQWRFERFAALKSFAAKLRKPWTDFTTQLDFMLTEAKKRGNAGWLYGHDLGAANRGMKAFERYGDNSEGTRMGNARAWNAMPDETASKIGDARQRGVTVQAPIHVHGVTDPEAVSRHVVRHIEATYRSKSHDIYIDVG